MRLDLPPSSRWTHAEQSNAGQVLAIGEILVDFIVADGATTLESAETFVARSGGAPANASVALARLGLASAFCGVVGDDQFGSRLQAELAAEGRRYVASEAEQ